MICVIGVGSPSGDDQAGWWVVDALRALGLEAQGVKLIKLDRPGATLLTEFGAADCVILIDAIESGGQAGAIRQVERAEWPMLSAGLSSHGFGVACALALAESLGELPARIEVYGIELGHAQPTEAPTPAVKAAVGTLAHRIAQGLSGAASCPSMPLRQAWDDPPFA